jgi:hypothetical protein
MPAAAAKSAAAANHNRDPPSTVTRRGARNNRDNNGNTANNGPSNNNSNSNTKALSPQPPQSAPPKFASKIGILDDEDPKAKLRRDARRITNSISISESFSRLGDGKTADAAAQQEPAPPASDADAQGGGGNGNNPGRGGPGVSTPAATPSGQQLRRPRAAHQLRNTRSTRKRSHEEADDDAFSPLSASFPPPHAPTPSSAVNSRAGTPGPRPAKKARTGLRVKNS